MVAKTVKPILRVLFGYPVDGGSDNGFQGLAGTGLGRAQPHFEFTEGEFDGVEGGRLRR